MTLKIDKKALDYCTFCPKMCRFSCPVAREEARETITPGAKMGFLRLVVNQQISLTEELGRTFYHCTGCLRCQHYCLHQIDVPAALTGGRSLVKQSNLVPEEIQTGLRRFRECGNWYGVLLETTQPFNLLQVEIGVVPGCDYLKSGNDKPKKMVDLLRSFGIDGRLASLPGRECGGSPLMTAGEIERFDLHIMAWAGRLEQYSKLILGCARCTKILREELSSTHCGKVRIEHWLEALRNVKKFPEVRSRLHLGTVFYHDACSIGRGLGSYQVTRDLLDATIRGTVLEFYEHGGEAHCCGGEKIYSELEPASAEQASERLLGEFYEQGGDVIVTADPGCAIHMRKKIKKGVVLNLLDVLYCAFVDPDTDLGL